MVFSEDTKEKLHDKLNKCRISGFFEKIISSEDVGHMKASAKYYENFSRSFHVNFYSDLLYFHKQTITLIECVKILSSHSKESVTDNVVSFIT